MSASKVGQGSLPDPAPVLVREFVPGMGESETWEWPIGTAEELFPKYEAMKATAEAGDNTLSVTYRRAQGRASLVARFGRQGEGGGTEPSITTVEELYSIDVIKDISEAPYFKDLTDDQVAWIRYCVENHLTEDEITSEAERIPVSASLKWVSWSALMRSLRYHMLHGVESYLETGFILRESNYCARTGNVRASFSNINAVVTAPKLSSRMNSLIAALPSGEWLYRSPHAEHLGRGNWRVTREWQWALKWSAVYGGTWGEVT